jgi:hypothetical protein
MIYLIADGGIIPLPIASTKVAPLKRENRGKYEARIVYHTLGPNGEARAGHHTVGAHDIEEQAQQGLDCTIATRDDQAITRALAALNLTSRYRHTK